MSSSRTPKIAALSAKQYLTLWESGMRPSLVRLIGPKLGKRSFGRILVIDDGTLYESMMKKARIRRRAARVRSIARKGAKAGV
jgi:hypothetical protein